ncbi:hypothetical protein Q2V25_23420, partial [Escherichia coli]|nr:hypothetical protein [Escherichia coli]
LTALSAEFTIGEGELMAHDVPLGCAPDEYDDLISGTCSHLPYINNVLISAMSWSMVIETLNTNEGCFFIWRFIESNDKNISTSLISKSNDGLMFFSGEYVDIEPYLVGFSHYYSAAVTKISISKSKKKTMNFFKMNGFSSRDHWLDEMLRSEKILFLYDRVKGILKNKC